MQERWDSLPLAGRVREGGERLGTIILEEKDNNERTS
jgi:hypothetical protein